MAGAGPDDGRTLATGLAKRARDTIYRDFLKLTRANRSSRVLAAAVSEIAGDSAYHLLVMYPCPERITAAGFGEGGGFRAAFPLVQDVRIAAGAGLPFADGSFDIASSSGALGRDGMESVQCAFLSELGRVAARVFVSIPYRHFGRLPVMPLTHRTDLTRERLRALWPQADVQAGFTGLRLGPFSSHRYLMVTRAGA